MLLEADKTFRWEINEPTMNKSCAIFGDGIPNDSADEVNDILNAVAEQAESTGVDKRFILAVIVSCAASSECGLNADSGVDARVERMRKGQVDDFSWSSSTQPRLDAGKKLLWTPNTCEIVLTLRQQTHNGKGTCNANGTPDTPCPSESISQMIKDGTAGTADGDGLQQT